MTSVYASQATWWWEASRIRLVSQPSALWRRCRLWKISSHAKIALASSTRVVIACGRAVRLHPAAECFDDGVVGITDGVHRPDHR
jgi:hypothetical protein